MDKLNTGEKIAGIAGIALLLIMFIFDWFSAEAGGAGFEVSAGGNAWEWFGFIDIVLFLTVLAAIALAAAAATANQVNTPVALSAITAGLGILSTLLILYRIIDPPGGDVEELGVDVGRDIGVWLGLISAAAIAYGGWRAMEEEGTSFSEQRDRLGDDAPPPPPPPSSSPPSSTGPAA
ncbi:MAG TPA: hypothetical protein VHF58_02525 [Solirubrobacterales bacterium]|nr:hypothetical protein [Solirubrobacterales bacterium]